MRVDPARARLLMTAALLAALPLTMSAQPVVSTPPAPTSQVMWDHDGVNVQWFEVRVDGAVALRVAVAPDAKGGTFQAPLPLMVPGLRALTVAACSDLGCAASAPLVVMVVSGPIRWAPDEDPEALPQ